MKLRLDLLLLKYYFLFLYQWCTSIIIETLAANITTLTPPGNVDNLVLRLKFQRRLKLFLNFRFKVFERQLKLMLILDGDKQSCNYGNLSLERIVWSLITCYTIIFVGIEIRIWLLMFTFLFLFCYLLNGLVHSHYNVVIILMF